MADEDELPFEGVEQPVQVGRVGGDPPQRVRRGGKVGQALKRTGRTEQARAELRAAGERTTESAPGASELLSPQELQIARLAAEGLSNREIGQQLYLSPRTVGSHLYRVFPKLGITSRAQLAARLAATP